MHGRGVALLVFQHVTGHAVQFSRLADRHGGGVAADLVQTLASRLHAHQMHGLVVQEGGKHAHGVGAATNTGSNVIRQAVVLGEELLA